MESPPKMYPITWSVLRTAALFSVLAMIPVGTLFTQLKASGLSGDGPSYGGIAKAIAAGDGFQQPNGLWPGHPTLRRPPLWPLILALPFKFWSAKDPLSVMGSTELVLHAATIFGAALLAWMLSGDWRRMLLASVIVALWPGSQPYIAAGLSEPCSAAVLTIGTVLVCRGGRFYFWGIFVLGLLPLARPNFIILPVWAASVLVVLWVWCRQDLKPFGSPRRLIGAAALFFVPFAGWLIRNYEATGAFPVASTNVGQDLYGSYNSLSATVGGPHFARWIAPDVIPGQERIASLATRMSELELNRYYQAKGRQFITDHWRAIPALILGHGLYAAMPQWPPFGTGAPGVKYSRLFRSLEWICRLALYAMAIVYIWRGSLRLDSWYGLIVASGALVTATTVLFYVGLERYLYQLTVLLVPFVCSAGANLHALTDRRHSPPDRHSESLSLKHPTRAVREW